MTDVFGVVQIETYRAFADSQIGEQEAFFGVFKIARPRRKMPYRMTLRGCDRDNVGAIDRAKASRVSRRDVCSKLNNPKATQDLSFIFGHLYHPFGIKSSGRAHRMTPKAIMLLL